MRLIVNEFLKLLSKRIFTVCLVISLFANVAFLYYTQKNDYNCQLIMEIGPGATALTRIF